MITFASIPGFGSTESYRLSAELTDDTRSRGLSWAVPGEADQDELLLQKLGTRGWGRLHHFRLLYQSGWGEGKGRPVSPRAVNALVEFLERFSWPEGVMPSLFLTDRGGVEVAWEEHEGDSAQIEFHRDGIEVYREATGTEAEVGLGDVPHAVELLA